MPGLHSWSSECEEEEIPINTKHILVEVSFVERSTALRSPRIPRRNVLPAVSDCHSKNVLTISSRNSDRSNISLLKDTETDCNEADIWIA